MRFYLVLSIPGMEEFGAMGLAFIPANGRQSPGSDSSPPLSTFVLVTSAY